MRRSVWFTFALVSCALAGACGGGPPGSPDESVGLPPRQASPHGPTSNGDPSSDAPVTPPAPAPDPAAGAGDPTKPADPTGTPAPVPCDPANPAAGTKVLEDLLDADHGAFAAVPGFAAGSWTYLSGALRQTRLADAADATWLAHPVTVADTDVVVSAASTEVSDAITPLLRQMFVLLGANMSGTTLTAYGCGAEVVAGLNPTQRTSVVKLTGTAAAVTTTPLARTARQALQAGEIFTLHAHAKAGTITCTLTQGAGITTTATASGLDTRGSIGLYTRQTKSSFQKAKICAL